MTPEASKSSVCLAAPSFLVFVAFSAFVASCGSVAKKDISFLANVNEWNEKLERMLIASTAMPEDVGSDKIVDGIVVGDVLHGSNINPDGTVYNHNLIHIDYMTTIVEEMAETAAVYTTAGRKVPEAAAFNVDKIYNALINVITQVRNGS